MEVIRKNLVTIRATFTPIAGQVGTPSAARVDLVYLDLSGAEGRASIDMAQQTDGSWTAEWDSSAASNGEVEWAAYCWGGLQAADQGRFVVKANRANKA